MRRNSLASLWSNVILAYAIALIGAGSHVTFAAQAQEDVGQKLYKKNSSSVFLLFARSASGEFVGQGSGFLVAGEKIVTNAHVANAGKIYIVLGGAKIPAKVELIDKLNDIAVLSTNVELTSSALRLSRRKATPGETVYTISNPEGLEKSITQGLVSAVREIEGRELIQLSAPISHGSSGGPIFDLDGDVLGIAVGSLTDGQNLNFAIPVDRLRALLENGASAFPSNALATLEEVRKVQQEQRADSYSANDDSPWQAHQKQINNLLTEAVNEAGNDVKILTQIAQVSLTENTEISVEAARRGINIKPSPELQVILAKGLTTSSWFASDANKGQLLEAAEVAARAAILLSRSPNAEMYYTLADILGDRESYSEAQKEYKLALTANINPRDEDLQSNIFRGLINCASHLGKSSEAEGWFKALVSSGKPSAWDWRAEGERLFTELKYADAAQAYATSGTQGGGYTQWCLSAFSASLVNEDDTVLSSARKCIDEATGKKDSETNIGIAHREIAQVLNKRGVYSEALAHAKEAATLTPEDASAYDEMADALFGLRRFQEVVTAAQQAIRLSDGKFAWMHFRLGSGYFELQNWEFARQSFEKAAELNPKLAPAAYNVGLCYVRLGYYRDAVKWYEEYLRRSPSASDRSDVEQTISRLRQK